MSWEPPDPPDPDIEYVAAHRSCGEVATCPVCGTPYCLICDPDCFPGDDGECFECLECIDPKKEDDHA